MREHLCRRLCSCLRSFSSTNSSLLPLCAVLLLPVSQEKLGRSLVTNNTNNITCLSQWWRNKTLGYIHMQWFTQCNYLLQCHISMIRSSLTWFNLFGYFIIHKINPLRIIQDLNHAVRVYFALMTGWLYIIPIVAWITFHYFKFVKGSGLVYVAGIVLSLFLGFFFLIFLSSILHHHLHCHHHHHHHCSVFTHWSAGQWACL